MRSLFIKIFWFFANPVRKSYWFIFRPQTRGVKCLIENNDRFLMVKLNYAHRKWTTPGAGVVKNESSIFAAIRETKEETGINITNPIYIGFYKSNIEYKDDTVEIYYSSVNTLETKIDLIEIADIGWFQRDGLPENRSGSVDRVFKLYDEFRFIKN